MKHIVHIGILCIMEGSYMEMIPLVYAATGWITLALVTVGFTVWGVFIWRQERRKNENKP